MKTRTFLSKAVGPSRDPSRAGAIWVAGTGAFLLLVACAVFVASNWDRIPPPAKLAAISFLTGVFLTAGRSLRRTLPGTAGALTHLGAFLIPVDVMAMGVHLHASAEVIALVEGVVGAAAFWLIERSERSGLLRGASAAAVVVACAGFAGIAGIPAALVLAAVAGVGLIAGVRRAAVGWALIAGLAPLAAITGFAAADPPWVLTTFGLAGDAVRGWAALSGLLCATVLAVEAQRRTEPGLAVLALVTGVVGVGTSWASGSPSVDTNLVAAALVVLAAEVTALLLRHDPFWSRLTATLASVLELVAVAAALAGGLAVAAALGADAPPEGTGLAGLGAGLAITSASWVIADLRRRDDDGQTAAIALLTGAGDPFASVAAALCGAGAVALLAGPPATGVALAGIAGLLVSSGRPSGRATAAVLVTAAPFCTGGEPAVTAALGVSGAVLLAWAAVLHVEVAGSDVSRESEAAWGLAAASILPVAGAAVVLAGELPLTTLLLGVIAVLWATAAVLDLASSSTTEGIGILPRAASLVALLPAAVAGADAWLIAILLVALAAIEAARRREPGIAATAAVSLPAAILLVGTRLGVDLPELGLVLVSAAAASAAAALLAPDRWSPPATAITLVSGSAGVLLAVQDPSTAASLALLVGTALLGAGILDDERTTAWAGAVLLALGIEAHLGLAAVQASEAYLAPVCALLVALGWSTRRHDDHVTSWLAYGPAIVAMGGAALLERMDGGGQGHALIAGLVGVVAVAIGGSRRLAAPLFLGTALLVAVAGYESLAVTADLPTWVWLALGGSMLLGTGVGLERAETGPVEGGRRLVDAIHERFD